MAYLETQNRFVNQINAYSEYEMESTYHDNLNVPNSVREL
jgi:hypothetical protein